MKRRALVTDVDQRVGLYAAQCLGRNGWHVTGTVTQRRVKSRYLDEVIPCTVDALPELLADESRWQLVLPVSIHSCWSAQSWKDTLETSEVPILGVDRRTLALANDKGAVVEAAAQCDVLAPKTALAADATAAAEILEDFGLPAVVKLRNDLGTHLAPADRYQIVRTPADLAATPTRFAPGLELLVQEYIEGQGGGVGLLIDARGRTQARVAYRRLREYPARGGPSTVAQTLDDPTLIDAAERLRTELGLLNGVAHIEFKLTSRGPVLMEVNPRLWGTVRLAEWSGQPLIQRWIQLALGTVAQFPIDYRPGVRARSLGHDLKLARESARDGNWKGVARVLGDLLDPRIRPLVFAGDDLRGSLSPWTAPRIQPTTRPSTARAPVTR